MQLLTMNEVTVKLAVSDDTIRREVANGNLQAYKIGRQWRFSEDMLTSYLNRRKTESKKIKIKG